MSLLDRCALGLFLLLAVLPVGAGLLYAALYGFGLTGLLADGFTLAHWQRVSASREVWACFGLSLGVAAAVALLTAALALPLALVLRSRLRQGPLGGLLSLPLAVPGTVAGLLALQLLAGAGLLSRLLVPLGLVREPADFPALVNDPAAAGIVLTHAALAVPFFVLLFGEIFESERLERLLELAAALGAGRGQALRRVAVPVLLRRAAPSLALLFVSVLGSYEIPLLVGRQSPQMISVLVMRKYALFDIAQKPEAFIVALGYTLLVLGVVALAFRRGPLDHGR